jgi:hypothetical protein
MDYDKEKLRNLPDKTLHKFGTNGDGKLSCNGVSCTSDNCPFKDCCGETNDVDIINSEKLRRSTKSLTPTNIYRLFLESLDLSKIESEGKKIPLIKMVRVFSNQFNLHAEEGTGTFGLKEAKELVEEVFTPEQLYPVTKCTDHTKWKAGDKILVSNYTGGTFKERIFMCYLKDTDQPFVVVDYDEEGSFPEHNFATNRWECAYKEIK